MTKPTFFILAALGSLQAQQVVAPTTETVGSARGLDWGQYNITQSYEAGYRFRLVGGDEGQYRSIANYGNGLRLFGANIGLESKDGHGHYFDELLLNASGLGNDPYESASLRVQKNGLYRYDMSWRLSNYFNPGLATAAGTHLENTGRRLQDHDLTLLPQGHFQVHLGYSRNSEDGPALSTASEFNTTGAAYPLFTDVRRRWNEYRAGFDAEVAGFKLTVLHRWDYYRDDTPASFSSGAGVGTGTSAGTVQQFVRSQPVHGRSPGWLGNLHTRRKLWAMNARLTYVSGHNDFTMAESAAGLDASGGAASRQIAVGGDASRPALASDLSLSFFPTSKLTFVNNTSISNNRIDGQSSYTELLNGSNSGATIYLRYLAIRTVTNTAEVNYQAKPWFGVYGAWRYASRQVRTIEGFDLPAFANSASDIAYEVGNQMQSGYVGLRVKPWKPFTINVEGELGRTNNPLTTVSEKNFSNLKGRAQYRTKKVQLSTAFREAYNFNSSFSLFSSHSRSYTASGVWQLKNWLALDTSYNKLHTDGSSFLAFFAGAIGGRASLQTKYRSIYISNIHSVNLGLRFPVTKRASVFAGYNLTKDTGDGRASAIAAGDTGAIASLLSSVQTFPLTYESPLLRVSVRVSEKLRWNAGLQFYDYAEKFGLFSYNRNFHAHTGYTSLLWTF